MTLFTALPLLAFIPVLLVLLPTLNTKRTNNQNGWLIAVVFFALFSIWSLFAVLREGPLGFWPNHSQGFWGNQVWFDLLMGLTMAWVLIAPRAKAQGMKLPLWMLFVLCSGSIGFSAMLGRMLYLERAKTK
jgi:hypothetical protein